MRILLIKISFILLIASAFTGCKKNDNISDKQVVLFQYEYINHAWDYQHYGYFIDNDGNVITFNNPEDWNFPDNDYTINQDRLLENLSKCSVSEKIIPIDEIQKFSKYIENIAASKVSALKNVGADIGSYTYICYQFDEESLTYKGHIIKMEGDNTCENLNFFSKKVISWMKEITVDLSLKSDDIPKIQ